MVTCCGVEPLPPATEVQDDRGASAGIRTGRIFLHRAGSTGAVEVKGFAESALRMGGAEAQRW